MMAVRKAWSSQSIIFVFGLVLFFITAFLGWGKLKYGFNFLDEGWHMTESWRLAAGDHFLRDKFSGADTLYTLINASIFKIFPNITLIGFRRAQFFITICSLLVFSIALFKVDKQYWYQPFIFSLFAFTGLSPAGWNSNLNYYTYPHVFLTLHVSFLLLGAYEKRIVLKRLMFLTCGLFIWGISFTLLHLSVVILSPILIFLVSNKLKVKSFSFELRDLFYVLGPFVLCWAIFIGIYNKAYILSLLKIISFRLKVPVYAPEGLIGINWEAVGHIGVTMAFVLACIFCFKRVAFSVWIAFVTGVSVLMFFVIDTSFFGLIRPYGLWFSRPMWFCSLLISFFILILANMVKKFYTGEEYTKGEELCVILMIPCAVLSFASSIFSGGMGVLTILHSSIPATAGIAAVVIYHKNISRKSYRIKLVVILILITPFYYTTAWSDWRYTYFDVFPEEANFTIEKGFGRGIKTNPIYGKLYEWIRVNTEKYSEKDDFMISYVLSPMVHMISKRRPSLGDTYTTFMAGTLGYYEELVENMKKAGRYPKIAFVFENMPALYPTSLKGNRFQWAGKQFTFPGRDPISRYVVENMGLIEECRIREGNRVRCFVDNKMIKKEAWIARRQIEEAIEKLEKELDLHPGDAVLYNKIGNLHKKKGNLDEAIRHYQKAVSIQPGFIEALYNLATAYAMKREDEKAVSFFKKTIEVRPDDGAAYYNIACIYAKQNRKKEAIDWLRKAIAMGYGNWDLIMADKDLENIRDTSGYMEIIRGH